VTLGPLTVGSLFTIGREEMLGAFVEGVGARSGDGCGGIDGETHVSQKPRDAGHPSGRAR